jgi:hypothetical protein
MVSKWETGGFLTLFYRLTLSVTDLELNNNLAKLFLFKFIFKWYSHPSAVNTILIDLEGEGL